MAFQDISRGRQVKITWIGCHSLRLEDHLVVQGKKGTGMESSQKGHGGETEKHWIRSEASKLIWPLTLFQKKRNYSVIWKSFFSQTQKISPNCTEAILIPPMFSAAPTQTPTCPLWKRWLDARNRVTGNCTLSETLCFGKYQVKWIRIRV